MILTLTRETLSPATVGTLAVDGAPECDTLERPWMDNQRMRSCIPPGAYKVTMRYSDKFQRPTLHVEGVQDRDGILIHPANQVTELLGCIALGKRLSADSLMESRMAVARLEGKVRAALSKGEGISIEIRNPEPVA